uniref:RRM domain-containing protein n=1 Tax=Timema cristinae TaxID=61476 RepID=A0A7R9GZZ8_TIMCR|nr:unnamed protein product [Timema cristinae]
MAEDFDVEAMLEAPYKKGTPPFLYLVDPNLSDPSSQTRPKQDEDDGNSGKPSRRENGSSSASHRSGGKNKHGVGSRDRRRSKSRSPRHRSGAFPGGMDRHHERDRGGHRDKERPRDHNSRRTGGGNEKEKERERERERERDREREKKKKSLSPIMLPRVREKFPFKKGPSPLGLRPLDELSPEERDARTVFCMQLSQRIRARDLEEFFSSVGKVRDVRLITCNKTRRFKGIAYVEFKDPDSVPLAMGLSGQKLLGIPIIVQHTQAEKNRAGNSMPNMILPKGNLGPMRLYVGSLHFNITEEMLRGIFEPFGKIDNIQLITDPETGRSKGYGFLTFHNSEDAKKALEQLNGFELAGRPMKVGHVTERTDSTQGPSILDSDDLDRTGIDLGATGRLQLMFKLAEGTGLQIPQAAASALNLNPIGTLPVQQAAPPIATQCFMLANMFDPIS